MRFNLTLILAVVMHTFCIAQNNVKIFGVITDAASGEVLPSASVYDVHTLKGAVANTHGYYTLVVPQGSNVTIQVSYIGYQEQHFKLHTQNDTVLNIQLTPGIQLQEFEITAKRYQQMVKQTGLIQMPVKDILFTPVFMGEANLVSALKTLPGVSSGKEGGSELFVRGGGYDQNLILLDEAPVYNLNHAFGLLSVFNASMLKNVNLYKGGIPAEYGGRLSSVLDITTRDGNKKEYNGELSLSTIAGALTFEGPIKKDKASFLFSARRSWIDQLIFAPLNTPEQKMGLYFYDINGKINFKIKEKHNFYLSYYTGKDELNFRFKDNNAKSKMRQGWGNQLASLRYNTVLHNGSFAQMSIYYTEYDEYDIINYNDKESKIVQGGESLLRDFGVKGLLNWSLSQNLSLKTGLETNWRSLSPPSRTSKVNGETTKINTQDKEEQMAYAAYTSLMLNHNKWQTELGVRGSLFSGNRKNFAYIEPRLNVSYLLTKEVKLKASAMRNAQPLFAMQKNNNGFPGYTWIPLSNQLQPQDAYQTALGATYTKGSWMIDLESYYKVIKHQASNYRFPYDIFSANNWFTLIDQGEGRAYGAEFLTTYNNLGWDVRLSYTLAKAESRYSEVNNGEWFPFDYDIRHDASLVTSKTIYNKNGKQRWFTSNFTLHSGTPVSMPTYTAPSTGTISKDESYFFDFSRVDYYTQPNNARLPLYHRLDLAYHAKKEKDRGSRTWSLGIINAYNRQNPYIYYREDNGKFKQLILFPIMPSVAFKRSF